MTVGAVNIATSLVEDTKLSENGFLKEKQKEEMLIKQKEQYERSEKARKQKEDAYNKEINAVMSMVATLKAKYPLADEELFNRFIFTFSTCSVEQSEELKEEIRKQHEERAKKNVPSNSVYTINDILQLECVDNNYNLPVSVKTFINPETKSGADYIVLFYNCNSNNYFWYTTKEIVIAKALSMKLLKFMQETGTNDLTQNEFTHLVDVVLLENKLSA